MLRKLIGAEGCSTPAGIAGQVRPRRLTASPAESEHPVAEINYYFLFYNSNIHYEMSLLFCVHLPTHAKIRYFPELHLQ